MNEEAIEGEMKLYDCAVCGKPMRIDDPFISDSSALQVCADDECPMLGCEVSYQ